MVTNGVASDKVLQRSTFSGGDGLRLIGFCAQGGNLVRGLRDRRTTAVVVADVGAFGW